MQTWNDIFRVLQDIDPNRLSDPAVVWIGAETRPVELIIVEADEIGDERLIAITEEDLS